MILPHIVKVDDVNIEHDVYDVNSSLYAAREIPEGAAMQGKDGYHHGDLRNALLAAGAVILEEEGLAGLSLRAVARRAGVSQTAPYRHFRDKAALMAAIATEGFRDLGRAMRDASVMAGEEAHLLAMGRAYMGFARQHGGIYRLMFGPEISRIDRDDDYWRASRAAFDQLREAFARHMHEAEARTRAIAAWAQVHGLALLILDDLLALQPGESIESLIDQVLLTNRR